MKFCGPWIGLVMTSTIMSGGCLGPQSIESVVVTPIPHYQRFDPPIYDEFRNVIDVDRAGSPYLGVWDTGLTQLVAVNTRIYCGEARYGQRPHSIRLLYNGTWPTSLVNGDTLRGTLVHSESVPDPLQPVPIPDSIGAITGGSFALGVREDTLQGYAQASYVGPCACAGPVPIILVKESP
mgnify:CR=1 FL=1